MSGLHSLKIVAADSGPDYHQRKSKNVAGTPAKIVSFLHELFAKILLTATNFRPVAKLCRSEKHHMSIVLVHNRASDLATQLWSTDRLSPRTL